MKLVELTEKIYLEINSARRVSKCMFTKDELKMFLGYVDYINHNVGDYVTSIDTMVDGENFKIPSELRGLFYPSRIVFNPEMDRACVNLINKQPVFIDGDDIAYDYSAMVMFINKLYATFRKVPAFTESLIDVRRIVALSDYTGSTAWQNSVRANYNQDAIPCPLIYRFYEDYMYNMSAEDYCIIALRNIISKLAN